MVLHNAILEFKDKVGQRHGEHLTLCPSPFKHGVGVGDMSLPLFQGGCANLSSIGHSCEKPLRCVDGPLKGAGHFRHFRCSVVQS